MRLKTLKYKDKVSEWELAPIDFFPDLTLLVGVSGVGKTRILKSIEMIRAISQGRSPWGIEWDVTFSTGAAQEECDFVWRGEFEGKAAPDEHEDDVADLDEEAEDLDLPHPRGRPKARILTEYLQKDGVPIIERDSERILLRGKETPKLSPYQSALMVLSHEDGIAAAHHGFHHILTPSDDENRGLHQFMEGRFAQHCKKFNTLDAIQALEYPTSYKLALIHATARPVFDQIVQRFIEVFPQVEQVTVELARGPIPIGLEYPVVKLKEYGCGPWIRQEQISSGMLRTLYHLARMALWPDGTVVLIDEFEDSLGVNCIDFVTHELVNESRRLQFVITSHHPYIINNINVRNWKILSRKGSVVNAANATELGLERSSHQSFMKLLNLEQYKYGITLP